MKKTSVPISLLLISLLAFVMLEEGGLPLKTAYGSPNTSTLTVGTQDIHANTITGYYVVVSQDGNVVASGFSPSTFTLNDGQTYTVEVANYGSCYFNNWADTNYSNDPRNITIQNNLQLMGVFDCGGPQQQGSLIINSVNAHGVPFPGYYAVLFQNGNIVASGFTQATFGTTSGQTYTLQVDDYGTCTFEHWQDTMSTVRQRTFVASGSTQVFTAVYACGVSISEIAVDTTNSNHHLITGYYVSLWQNGMQIQSCFSPCSFLVDTGQTYQVAVSDYGGEVFNHWLNGVSTRFQTVSIPGGTPAIGLTAVYSP